jgi:hypothetical protein
MTQATLQISASIATTTQLGTADHLILSEMIRTALMFRGSEFSQDLGFFAGKIEWRNTAISIQLSTENQYIITIGLIHTLPIRTSDTIIDSKAALIAFYRDRTDVQKKIMQNLVLFAMQDKSEEIDYHFSRKKTTIIIKNHLGIPHSFPTAKMTIAVKKTVFSPFFINNDIGQQSIQKITELVKEALLPTLKTNFSFETCGKVYQFDVCPDNIRIEGSQEIFTLLVTITENTPKGRYREISAISTTLLNPLKKALEKLLEQFSKPLFYHTIFNNKAEIEKTLGKKTSFYVTYKGHPAMVICPKELHEGISKLAEIDHDPLTAITEIRIGSLPNEINQRCQLIPDIQPNQAVKVSCNEPEASNSLLMLSGKCVVFPAFSYLKQDGSLESALEQYQRVKLAFRFSLECNTDPDKRLTEILKTNTLPAQHDDAQIARLCQFICVAYLVSLDKKMGGDSDVFSLKINHQCPMTIMQLKTLHSLNQVLYDCHHNIKIDFSSNL